MRRTPLRRYNPRRQYTHDCEQCGATYHPEGRDQRYCSRACSDVGRTLPRQICPVCGNPRQDRKHSDRTYCSRACAAKAAVKPRATCPMCQAAPVRLGSKTCSAACGYELRKSTRKPRACEGCGKSFLPYPSAIARGRVRFCSIACFRTMAAKRPAYIEVACRQCGASFRRTAAAIKRLKGDPFCSRTCAAAGLSGESSPIWRGGKRRGYRGPGWQRIAETVRERDGRRCRRCGKTEEAEGRRLSVDHIRPYRTFADHVEANQLENLVALCSSCHGSKSRAETRWLKGDVLEMWQYQVAVSQPWPDEAVS